MVDDCRTATIVAMAALLKGKPALLV